MSKKQEDRFYWSENVAEKLWCWGRKLEKLGNILFYMIVTVGVLYSFYSYIGAAVSNASYEEVESSQATITAFLIALKSLFMFGVCAFIEYLAYRTISLIVSALAGILENTASTARDTEKIAFNSTNDVMQNRTGAKIADDD